MRTTTYSSRPASRRRPRAVAGVVLLIAAVAAHGETRMPGGAVYTPRDPDSVLAVLPDSTSGERLAEYRQTLNENPSDLAAATRLAREYLSLASRHGDPRYAGYARAALANWWTDDAPPASVLYLRARYRQYRHDFAGALTDLDRLLALHPRNANAWMLRASVERVRGDLAAAADSCARVDALGAGIWGRACEFEIAALTGRLEAAREAVTRTLESTRITRQQRTWLRTLAANMAMQAGEPGAAVEHLRASEEPANPYRLARHADALLNQDDAEATRALLREHASIDPLLLRLAIAERHLGDPAWRKHRAELRDRFEAAARRGDALHWRERAYSALALEDDPASALTAARHNWANQRELADARLLVRAAIAAESPSAAQPVRTWVRRHGVQDHQLAAMLASLESGPGSEP